MWRRRGALVPVKEAVEHAVAEHHHRAAQNAPEIENVHPREDGARSSGLESCQDDHRHALSLSPLVRKKGREFASYARNFKSRIVNDLLPHSTMPTPGKFQASSFVAPGYALSGWTNRLPRLLEQLRGIEKVTGAVSPPRCRAWRWDLDEELRIQVLAGA